VGHRAVSGGQRPAKAVAYRPLCPAGAGAAPALRPPVSAGAGRQCGRWRLCPPHPAGGGLGRAARKPVRPNQPLGTGGAAQPGYLINK
nr:hypothetical protein [Tanacetum cinerariifolium]